jgi:integrase/recombinase XerD
VPVPSPKESFRSTARGFLGDAGRLPAVPAVVAGPYEDRIQAFLQAQQARSLAPHTCIKRIKQARRFVAYLEQLGCVLEQVCPSHLDAYFQQLATSWCRLSMRTAAEALRAWLHYCEEKGYVGRGLANAVLAPRIYRYEGIPLGPTWEQVSRVVAQTEGSQPEQLRARAILLLLAVYGIRSGEVCRLQIDDIDWRQETIRFTRSKSGRADVYPLDATVGNAIVDYLRHARPLHPSRVVFLTLHAPFRALSGQALYHLVHKRLARVIPGPKGRNPHALRHACTRRLMDAGFSLKVIGDHLGHRSAEATRIYTKVDLNALRLVAMENLRGLA